jgi:hypothetical protein
MDHFDRRSSARDIGLSRLIADEERNSRQVWHLVRANSFVQQHGTPNLRDKAEKRGKYGGEQN